MPAISVGSVEVDVLPNARGIYGRLEGELLPAARRIGDEAGRIIGQRIAANITSAVRDGVQNGARAARPAATRGGEQAGGAFARSLRARLEAAFRSMPKLDVRLGDTGIDADLARLRARLEALSGKTVGIDIDAATARAQAADIEERLRRIGAAHPNVAVRADTAAAIAQLQLLQQQIDDVTRDPARIRVETDGTFGQRLRAQVQAAEASLPNINLTADSSQVDVEIARLRAQLTALRDVRIGVDMDTATATARIQAIQARLQALSASDADVAVRVDAGAAAAQLAGVQAMVNRLDGQTANINVHVSGMQMLVTAALAFGPALLPVLPVAAAGLGAVAAAATAAAVGIGGIAAVAVPAFMQIGKVLQAQKAAQDAATNATLRGGQASGQGAQRALQMASAQQSLAAAHRNAARQIRQAEQGVADAARNAVEANARAADQVKQAKRGLADAVQQAADRQRSSAEQVRSAEESLANAQRSARQAQEDLTQARADAAQQLEDLQSRLANAQLSERDAVLGVEEARLRLQKVQQAGSQVSLLEQQRAQLAYDQAVQRLKDQQAETKDLKAEKQAADKAGVEGSELVLDAQERLREAEQGVADQQRVLGKAREDAARQAVQSQRDIADAQERVAESQRNVTRTQEDGARSVARAQEQLAAAQQSAADSIASAQRQIASASQSAAGGVDQAAIAQAKYQAELAKLTPSARETLKAFVGLKDAFGAWSKSLQPAVMPIFTRALNGIRRALPGLTPFVLEAADAIKGLQDRASAGFKSPWWKTFKQDVQGSIKPAITGLGVSFGNVFKGMAGVMQAFFPHMDSISERMQRITERFANWGTSLKGSPAFERFLSYSSQMGPVLADTFGKIATALMDIGRALQPVSKPLLELLGAFASGLSHIATTLPEVVVGLWGLLVVTRLWSIAMFLAGKAMALFNLISMAGPWGWIALAIAGVVVAVIYLYRRFEWFRTAVQAVWSAIQTGAMWLWNNALKPAFTAIWGGLQTVGRWAMWLWNNAIKPAFDGIVLVGKILLTALVTLVLLPIVAVIKIVGAIAMWLWTTAIKPAFEAIGAIAMWLWTTAFRPAFQFIGDKAKWLWNNAIKPAWNGIQTGAKWMWEKVLRPVFRLIWEGMQEVGRWGKWLWQNALKPAWDGIVAAGKWAWENGIKPVFDRFKGIVKSLKGAFDTAVGGIKSAWDRVKSVSKKPVQYVVDVVYNNGIRGVWNQVASAFGAPKLPAFKFASGGIMPGYTPGRDVHQFMSPTGGRLELSGGEAIMRPEFTRAVGSGFVGAMNSVAKSRGAQGVKAALAPILGGNPRTPTDTSLRYASGGVVQSFADGGIFGWIKDKASAAFGAGSAAWNRIKEGASWLKDSLEASARAGVKNVVDPLLRSFPGADTGFGKMIRRVPTKIIDALFGYSKEADKRGAGGIGGPRIAAALKWAKTQNGLPYQWGGNGNPSWDCCIVGPVRVYGPNGATPIQDVQAGDEVYSYVDGKLTVQTVTAAWKSKTQPVFKVRTRNRAVTASANHPFMRLVQTAKSEHVKGGKRGEQIPAQYGIEWARLDELKRGDLLVQPREMEPVEVERAELPDGTLVTQDVAWLLGLFVGDGCLNGKSVRICVYDDISVRAQKVFRSLGANSFTAEKQGVIASSARLVRTLEAMGLRKLGPEKRVPDAVWSWNRELRQAFLDGYCDADGHRPANQDKHGERTYHSASRELIEDVRAMHIMLGHPVSNISTNRRSKPITIRGKEVKKALPLHSFTVWAGEGRGEGALRRLPGVAAWLDAGDFTLAKVLEVSDEGVQETYDLEVEGAHNFIADGVVVHNSGYMSAIESVIRGQKPHRRWSTHAFKGGTPPGWVKNGNSAFKVGITHAGVGHTAGTLGKTNVESRGGDGVVVGSRARGYNDRLFTSWYGFKPGSYDSGGYLQPGLNLAYNGTGRPEPVFTTAQANALTSLAARSAQQQLGDLQVSVFVGNEQITDIARAEVRTAQGELIQVLNAS